MKQVLKFNSCCRERTWISCSAQEHDPKNPYISLTSGVQALLLRRQMGAGGIRNLPGRQQGDQASLRLDFQNVKLASLL